MISHRLGVSQLGICITDDEKTDKNMVATLCEIHELEFILFLHYFMNFISLNLKFYISSVLFICLFERDDHHGTNEKNILHQAINTYFVL